MESDLTKQINTSTDVHLQMTKTLVDHYIVYFQQSFNQEERDEIIMGVFRLIQKKYIGKPNSKFNEEPRPIIGTVAKSFITQKIDKAKKNLEKPN